MPSLLRRVTAERPDTPPMRLDSVLRQSNRVSFESVTGQLAIIESCGQIRAVNEAWSRIAAGQWSSRRLKTGDNFLTAIRRAAVTGDEYAQSALLGLSSVLSGQIPSFMLRYPSESKRRVHWFEMVATAPGGSEWPWAVIVIHEDLTEGITFDHAESASSAPASPLSQIAEAALVVTRADCVTISLRTLRTPDECEVVASASEFPIDWDAGHTVTGSPCGDVHPDGYAFCSTGVQRRYPKASWLQTAGANGFADIAIRLPDGEFLGHLSIVHHAALEDPLAIEANLRLFATCALGEMERMHLAERREHADADLGSPEARYSAVFNAIADGIVLLDDNLAVRDANKGAEALFGIPISRLIGRRVTDLIQSARSLRTLQGQWHGSLTVARPDGTHIEVEASVTPMRDSGRSNIVLVGRESSTRDSGKEGIGKRETLSDQRRLKKMAISRAIPGNIFVVTRDGELVKRPIGHNGKRDSAVLPVGGLVTMVSEADRQRCQDAIKASIDQDEVIDIEFRATAESGVRVLNWRIAPYVDDQAIVCAQERPEIYGQDHLATKVAEETEIPRVFRRNPYGLTFRELTILNLLAGGTTDKEIAGTLCLSIYTVNKHVANILGKMQAVSRTEAAVRAAREGLVA